MHGPAAGSSSSKPAWLTINGMTYLPQQELTYGQTVAMVTEPGARNNAVHLAGPYQGIVYTKRDRESVFCMRAYARARVLSLHRNSLP